jgi:hypothetical protein
MDQKNARAIFRSRECRRERRRPRAEDREVKAPSAAANAADPAPRIARSKRPEGS